MIGQKENIPTTTVKYLCCGGKNDPKGSGGGDGVLKQIGKINNGERI